MSSVIAKQFNTAIEYEAVHLRDLRPATRLAGLSRYAVRPAGKLGTCGWTPFAWTVVYVNAHSPNAAIAKAERRGLIIHKKG